MNSGHKLLNASIDFLELQERLSSFENVPYVEHVDVEPVDNPYATYVVEITVNPVLGLKLEIINFDPGFFYNDKVYRFDVSHDTNFGHKIKFNKSDPYPNPT